jgi:hypothetical protein
MQVKVLVGLAFIAILVALGSAGVLMLREGRRGRSNDGRMMRALAWRVGLSVALFLAILFAAWMGWIQPTGLLMRR